VALRGTESDLDDQLFGSLANAINKAAATYNPAKIAKRAYDSKKLSKVGRTKEEEDADFEDEEEDDEETKARKKKEQEDRDAKARDASDSARGLNKDSDGGSIFAMLFKIVPIGLSLASRIKNVGRGFKNIAQGFAEEMVGLAVTSIRFFIDGFQYFFYLFQMAFVVLVCALGKIFVIHKCIPFYIVDVFLFIIYLAFFSVCFLIDVCLFLPYFFGFGLVDVFLLILKQLGLIDQSIYSTSGIHIFSYPDWIVQMCYRCDVMDTSGYEHSKQKLYNDLTKVLPKNVFNPIGRMVGGVGDVFSIFNI